MIAIFPVTSFIIQWKISIFLNTDIRTCCYYINCYRSIITKDCECSVPQYPLFNTIAELCCSFDTMRKWRKKWKIKFRGERERGKWYMSCINLLKIQRNLNLKVRSKDILKKKRSIVWFSSNKVFPRSQRLWGTSNILRSGTLKGIAAKLSIKLHF